MPSGWTPAARRGSGPLMDIDSRRIVIRHRHVAPMLSALLGGTNAAVRISDDAGT